MFHQTKTQSVVETPIIKPKEDKCIAMNTKEETALLKDVGFLIKVEKFANERAKKTTNTNHKKHYMKLFLDTGALMMEVVKILSPKIAGNKIQYNIRNEIKKIKDVAKKKGYDK